MCLKDVVQTSQQLGTLSQLGNIAESDNTNSNSLKFDSKFFPDWAKFPIGTTEIEKTSSGQFMCFLMQNLNI